MASHNLEYIKIGELEVIGYSMAGEETVVAMPQSTNPDLLVQVEAFAKTQ